MRSSRFVAPLLAGALFSVAVAAPAFAAIRFTKIQYESPGPDTGSNDSLNAEFVVIKNKGTRAKILTGWKLIDKRTAPEANRVYRFPTFKLRPGRTVKIHTGKGTNTAGDLYWGKTTYVWGDDQDTAFLKNRAGREIDKCSYVSTTTQTSPPAYC
ncbi:MAG: lamin tail domain-containing protein [Actinobacteria bacterium]|nr:lamin tail domain-containing protein [Actinomycetota bacterium]